MTTTLNPSTILDAVRVITPQGLITVTGIVTRLSPYPKTSPTVIYGNLRDETSDTEISFKCPINKSPLAVGELATIQGSISFHYKNRLTLRIDGDCINHQKPVTLVQHPINIKNERAKTKLSHFLEKFALGKLHIIGTPIAIKDLKSALNEQHKNTNDLITYNANFNAPDELLETAKQAIMEGATGIAFTRGGNDYTLKHWDDTRFISELVSLDCAIYTALGHANQSFWVEKYASDESFTTPTALGTGISKALKNQNQKRHTSTQLNRAQQHQKKQEETLKTLNKQNQTLKKALGVIAFLLLATLWFS